MTHTPGEFEGVGVAVVGGAQGVGPAVVAAFALAAARVTVGLMPATTEPAQQPNRKSIEVDLDKPETFAGFLDACEAQAGPLRVLVMVPPPVKTGNALDIDAAQMRKVIEQELLGPMLLMQAAARRMAARGEGGRIISFVSMSGKTGVHKHVAPYAAAKGGLIAFSRVLAAELAPQGITVNAIATALFDVQVANKTPQERAALESGIPIGRAGKSVEAAHAALFLASRNAAFVTGETLNLSGGRFMD